MKYFALPGKFDPYAHETLASARESAIALALSSEEAYVVEVIEHYERSTGIVCTFPQPETPSDAGTETGPAIGADALDSGQLSIADATGEGELHRSDPHIPGELP